MCHCDDILLSLLVTPPVETFLCAYSHFLCIALLSFSCARCMTTLSHSIPTRTHRDTSFLPLLLDNASTEIETYQLQQQTRYLANEVVT